MPNEFEITSPDVPVPEEELEDSFATYCGPVRGKRDSLNVYHPKPGIPEPDGFLHLTCGILNTEQLLARAHALGVTVNTYLIAVLLWCGLEHQKEHIRHQKLIKPVRAQIPINLRRLYPSVTMRNFVAVANIEIDARLGEYTFEEVVKLVHHQVALQINPKYMQTVFTSNVKDEQNPFIRWIPLSLKTLVMRIVFDRVGEAVTSFSISNLGNIRLPEEMKPYVERIEFILGAPLSAPANISVTSWKGRTFINFTRNSIEADFERRFLTFLVKDGLHVYVESNQRPDHTGEPKSHQAT